MKRLFVLIIVLAIITGATCGCNGAQAPKMDIIDATSQTLVSSDLLLGDNTPSAGHSDNIKKPSKTQIRNASNNLQNDCAFTTDGEFLYCSSWDYGMDSSPEMLKISLNNFSVVSSYKTKMSDGVEFNPMKIFCVGDIIHYSLGTVLQGIYPEFFILNTKFSDNIELPFSIIFSEVQTDGTFYYASDYSTFGDYGLYRARIEDISNTQDLKDVFTKISNVHPDDIIMQGDYLYVVSYDAILNGVQNENTGMWRMNLDGSDPIRILTQTPDMVFVSENRIYTLEDYSVYSMDLDGADRFLLTEVYPDGFSMNITDEYIFYSHDEYGILHRANLDGTNDIQLNMCGCSDIAICGEWIVYLNKSDRNYYKMRFDGTSHCLISEVPVEEEATEAPTEPELIERGKGSYTLEEAQEETGLFVRYSDGSFDRYHNGHVMTWNTLPMTYGSDDFPEDLIVHTSRIERNRSLLGEGQLVLFWPYENRVREGLHAVEESGYSLFRTNGEGNLEGLILTRDTTTGNVLVQWNQGHTFYWSNSINYSLINGIPKDEYDGFPSTEGRDFGSFPANQVFTIGAYDGSTLVEQEYTTDYMYFLHSDEKTPYEVIPTMDGYYILDFANTPSGEYVYTVSYWDPDRLTRRVASAYVEVE